MAKQKFLSEKSWLTAIIFWGTILLLFLPLLQVLLHEEFSWGHLLLCAFLLAVQGFLLWTWLSTYYLIDGTTLFYASGPIKGRIAIHSISRIKLNARLWSGLRPALGMHGLVIYYNKWDEIYLSPQEKEQFVMALRQVHVGISVEQ